MAATQVRIVKQILSGDSLVVREQARGCAPTEQTVFLSYVSAPKIRRGKDSTATPDEPLAWEAREFLRNLLVGKEVRMREDYQIQAARELTFVTLYLRDDDQSVQAKLVSAGLVEVSKRKQNAENEDVIALTELEVAAQQAQVGKWGDGASAVTRETVLQDITREDAQALVGRTFTAIVEHVSNGSSFKVGFFTPLGDKNSTTYQLLSVNLSGVRCPALHEELGEQAKFFSESRLLNRDVQVRVEQVQALNFVSVVGSISLSGHNIALYLLREGFARTMDRTIGLVSDGIEAYRNAETSAKNENKRLWRNYTAPTPSVNNGFSNKGWEGTVTEIVNAECIMVLKQGDEEPTKIWFSSIRGPKADGGHRDTNAGRPRPLYDVPLMWETREFLRKKLIGETVQVQVDYIQPKNDNNLPERQCATVWLKEINIAAALVMKGFATVIKRNDDQKSRAFDELLEAENKAQANGKGLFAQKSSGKAKLLKPTDISTDTSRASFHLESLTRGGQKDAVVEFVFSSTKFKLYLVKENMLINLVVGGVSVEKTGKADLNIKTIKLLLQHRDVKCLVERVDKAGNFIGNLYFIHPTSHAEISLAIHLLREGMCKVRDEKSSQLLEAQRQAQLAKRGVWVNWTEEEEVIPSADTTELELETGEDDADKDKDSSKGLERVVLSFVAPSALRIFVQSFVHGVQLSELMTEMRNEFEANPPFPGVYRPKQGDICAARFSEDGLWYRARVDKLLPSEGKAEITYIDHGNKDSVNVRNDLRALPGADRFGLSALPAVAKCVGLAFVYLPKNDNEWTEEIQSTLETRLGSEQMFLLKPQYLNAQGLEMCTLINATSGEDMLLNMVREGLFCVEKRLVGKRRKQADVALETYKQTMNVAIKSRVNLWRYGDIREEDTKEFGA